MGRAAARLEKRLAELPATERNQPPAGPAAVASRPAGAWQGLTGRLPEHPDARRVRFVDDALVDYEASVEVRVPISELFSLCDFERWEPILFPAPTWLHVDLLSTAPPIVTVGRSKSDMASGWTSPTPVNASGCQPDGDRSRRLVLA